MNPDARVRRPILPPRAAVIRFPKSARPAAVAAMLLACCGPAGGQLGGPATRPDPDPPLCGGVFRGCEDVTEFAAEYYSRVTAGSTYGSGEYPQRVPTAAVPAPAGAGVPGRVCGDGTNLATCSKTYECYWSPVRARCVAGDLRSSKTAGNYKTWLPAGP